MARRGGETLREEESSVRNGNGAVDRRGQKFEIAIAATNFPLADVVGSSSPTKERRLLTAPHSRVKAIPRNTYTDSGRDASSGHLQEYQSTPRISISSDEDSVKRLYSLSADV